MAESEDKSAAFSHLGPEDPVNYYRRLFQGCPYKETFRMASLGVSNFLKPYLRGREGSKFQESSKQTRQCILLLPDGKGPNMKAFSKASWKVMYHGGRSGGEARRKCVGFKNVYTKSYF